MKHNTCTTCGAKNGQCGVLFTTKSHGKAECLNCHKTRLTGIVTIHSHLDRTLDQLQKTMDIVKKKA